ncbi:MAG: hypothetical protein JO161_11375 [Planctomycetaceae bacterium]|nr:hypothetical protein [Planctomycetaceae bacterium]
MFVSHSFSGMILTDAGVHSKSIRAGVCRSPCTRRWLGQHRSSRKFPTPPASAGIVFDGDQGRLTEAAFFRDFAGDLPEAKKVFCAVREPFHKELLTGKTAHAAWREKPSFYAASTEDRTINPILSDSW